VRRPAAKIGSRPEHGFALLLLLVLMLAAFEVAAPDDDWARFVSVVLSAATLVAAILAAGARNRVAQGVVAASICVVGAAFLTLLGDGEVPELASAVLNGLLVAAAPAIIAVGVIRDVRRERAVSVRTLAGVLSIYVLAGMFFSFCFAAVYAIEGDFFQQISDPARSDFLYFSYVTISTVGYGDLTAASDVGRMFAITEALLGQIYLVTVVALIVSNLGRPRPSS
jgi:drug/metabolite transporter (DMT)-like permease